MSNKRRAKHSSQKRQQSGPGLPLRGLSLEQAGKIAEGPREPNRTRRKPKNFQEWKKVDLLVRAQEVGLRGRSRMTKEQLVWALREH